MIKKKPFALHEWLLVVMACANIIVSYNYNYVNIDACIDLVVTENCIMSVYYYINKKGEYLHGKFIAVKHSPRLHQGARGIHFHQTGPLG